MVFRAAILILVIVLAFQVVWHLPSWFFFFVGIWAISSFSRKRGSCSGRRGQHALPCGDRTDDLDQFFDRGERRPKPLWREKDLV